MRQILRYAMGLLALLLVLPACKRSNDIEEPTLDLSKNTLTFAKEASEQSVTVQTTRTVGRPSSSREIGSHSLRRARPSRSRLRLITKGLSAPPPSSSMPVDYSV